MRRYLTTLFFSFLICGLAGSALAPQAAAQDYRADDSFYLKLRGGGNTYHGERDQNPDGELLKPSTMGLPTLGLDIGYRGAFASWDALELSYQAVSNDGFDREFPLGSIPLSEALNADNTSQWRHSLGLIYQINFASDARLNPYLRLGADIIYGSMATATSDNASQVATQGRNILESESYFAFGPQGGFGLDLALSSKFGIFAEFNSMMTFSDNAIDGRVGQPDANGNQNEDFDFVNTYTGGVRYIFKSPFTPVQILAIDGPSELEVGDAGTFTAMTNEDKATKPLTYEWDFGDGSTGSGLTATHDYNSPGTYTVTFTASNSGSADERSLEVRVQRPPQPAEIVTITADPSPATAGEAVQFNSNVRGTPPITYEWDFGDGTTGTGRAPSHTYDEPGTYTVTLNVSNDVEGGEDSRTLSLEVEPPLPAVCREVTEFNPVYFERNSSTLTEEGRRGLQENIEILNQCPNLNVRVEGFALSSERNAEDLSSDRANAVAQFYQDGGVASSRITQRSQVERDRKGAGRQFRRVESIPVRRR